MAGVSFSRTQPSKANTRQCTTRACSVEPTGRMTVTPACSERAVREDATQKSTQHTFTRFAYSYHDISAMNTVVLSAVAAAAGGAVHIPASGSATARRAAQSAASAASTLRRHAMAGHDVESRRWEKWLVDPWEFQKIVPRLAVPQTVCVSSCRVLSSQSAA